MTDFKTLARSINVMIQSDWAASCDEDALATALEADGATSTEYPIPDEDGISSSDKKRFPRSCKIISRAC